MKLTLFKDFSDASSIITVQAGVPLCQQVETSGRRIIANGAEVSETYIPEENDIIIMRTIPGELTTILLVAIAAVSLIGGVAGGVAAYNARKQAEQLEEKMKNLNDSVANVPNLRGASNAVATGKTQPYLMGRHLFTPYFLSQPHYALGGVDGADQYYYATLEAGFRKQVIKSVAADDIVLKTFSDSSPQEGSYTLEAGPFYDSSSRIEISQDGAAFADANFNRKYITEYPGKELKKSDADDYEDLIFTLPEKARDVSLAISFRGLRAYSDSDGAKIDRTVVVKPYYSYNNGATWTEFTFNQNGTESNAFTRNVAAEIRFSAYKEFAYASVKDLTSPVLIKLVCETPKATGNALDQVYAQWVQSRIYDPDASAAAGAFVDEKPIADTEAALSTRIGIKLKATQTNEDKLGKINIVSNGVARTWTGSAWTTTKSQTSNAAAWLLEVLTSDTHLPSQLDDSEIDLDAFGELYEVCEAEGFNVNHVITDGDEKSAVLEMLCDICACTLYQNIYGEISVAVDAPKTNSIAILNAQNLLRFDVEREFSRKADGIRITYIDSGSYKQDSYLVMRDGETRTSNSIIRDMTVRGITDYEQVVKYARRLLALETLRPRTVRASVGKEGIYYTPLSRVLVQHPALSVGLGSAEIKSVIVEDGSITALELYEPIGEGAAIVQAVGADYCTPLEIEYTGSGTEIELVTPISSGAAVVPHPGDVLSWGSGLEAVTEEMLIAGIEPTDGGFDLTLVDYDEAIYEPGAIPLYTPNLSYVAAPVSAPVGIPGATLEDVNAVIGTLSTAPATPASLTARAVQDGIILLAAPGGAPGLDNSAAYYRYQVSRDGGLTWPGDWTAAAQAEFRFDRDVDGYPDSVSLYRARVKAVSAAGVESVSWLTVTVDGTGYAGWTPGTPGLSGSADNRTAELRLVVGGSYYGHSRFEVQIQRDGDGANWYAPGDSGAARDSETSYRGTVDGYATAYADAFAQTLPLINQAAGLPENTSYLYRIRAVVAKPTTAAPDAVARSAWTAAVTVVAKPTGTVDVVAGAIKTAQLDKKAVTIEKLNVLAKNLVNDLTDDADGTTGWTGTTLSRETDTSLTPQYKVGKMTATLSAAFTDDFIVGPNDIIELEYFLRAPGTATTVEARVGVSGHGNNYTWSTWNATAKTWGAFSGSAEFYILHGTTAALNTTYKRLLTYVVGINVQPDAIPAPVNDLNTTTYCLRVQNGVAAMSLVNRAGTGDLYIFAPSARKVGSGKIVAQQIVTKNLAAISAKLGEIQGDTADYKLVMGSGGSAEEGTLLLGATTDASYFRRWKEGGVWKMAIKLATLFVDAVSSKILGIFRVRNSADTATVFEVDPAGESFVAVPFRRLANFVTSNTGTSLTNYFGKIARITLTSRFQNVTLSLMATAETHAGVKQIARQIRFRVKQQIAFGSNPTIEAVEIKEAPEDYDRYRFYYQIVQNTGPTIVDVFVKIITEYTTVTGTVEHETDRASAVFYSNQTLVSSVSGAVAFTQYRSVTEDSDGLTTLAAVTASSLGVSGPVSVAGNAQVGSLNGATPRSGGLELLGLGDVDIVISAKPIQIGSGLSISGVVIPALAALNSTDVAFIDGANEQLRTYRWSGTSWSQIGSGLAVSGAGYPALAALNSTDVAFIDDANDQLRTYRWSGSSWSQIGSGLAVSGVVYPALAALNSTDVAFIDDANDQLRTYRWSGTSWSQIGSGLAVSGVVHPALAALNSTDVAFIDDTNDQLRTYRYSIDGTIPTIPTANVASEYTIERTLVTANIIFNVGCKQATVYEVITGLLGTTEGDIGCSGRYGTSDVGYLYIKSTEVTIRNVATTLVRIVCTKDSPTTIPVRITLQFPV